MNILIGDRDDEPPVFEQTESWDSLSVQEILSSVPDYEEDSVTISGDIIVSDPDTDVEQEYYFFIE